MSIRNTILTNLQTAIKAIEDDSDYELNIHRVSLFNENILKVQPHDVPMVMIIDTGKESIPVYDGTDYRYRWEVILRGVVNTDTAGSVHEDLNKMISILKQVIDAGPSLGDNALKIRIVEVVGNRVDEDRKLADTIIRCEIVYWCVAGTF